MSRKYSRTIEDSPRVLLWPQHTHTPVLTHRYSSLYTQKETKPGMQSVSSGTSAPSRPTLHLSLCPVCHQHPSVPLCILGPHWVFLQLLLPALVVLPTAHSSVVPPVPASVSPPINEIGVGGTCLIGPWEAGLVGAGKEVWSGLASGECPQ